MNERPEAEFPLAYLMTIRSYGTRLHGDKNGSVDRHGFNTFGKPRMPPSEILNRLMLEEMKDAPVIFDKAERICVLEAVSEVCEFRGYELLAVNIRTNHLHAVIAAYAKPEKIINDFKAYATRRLRKLELIGKDKPVWARGQSRRYLWKPQHVETAINYVLFGQGGEIPEFD